MSSTYTGSSSAPVEAAAYGGLADAIGGIATVVLAILALAGVHLRSQGCTVKLYCR